jgi:hypothetical protein
VFVVVVVDDDVVVVVVVIVCAGYERASETREGVENQRGKTARAVATSLLSFLS